MRLSLLTVFFKVSSLLLVGTTLLLSFLTVVLTECFGSSGDRLADGCADLQSCEIALDQSSVEDIQLSAADVAAQGDAAVVVGIKVGENALDLCRVEDRDPAVAVRVAEQIRDGFDRRFFKDAIVIGEPFVAVLQPAAQIVNVGVEGRQRTHLHVQPPLGGTPSRVGEVAVKELAVSGEQPVHQTALGVQRLELIVIPAIGRADLFREPVVRAQIPVQMAFGGEESVRDGGRLRDGGIAAVDVAGGEVIVPRGSRIEDAVLIVKEHGAEVEVDGLVQLVEQIIADKGGDVDLCADRVAVAALDRRHDIVHGAADIGELFGVGRFGLADREADAVGLEVGDVVFGAGMLALDHEVLHAVVALDVDVDAILALLNGLHQHITAAIAAVHPQLHIALLGCVREPHRTGEVEGEVVAHQRRVEGVRQQYPLLALAHAEDVLFLLELEVVRLLGDRGESGAVAAHLEAHAVTEDGTVGTGDRDGCVDGAVRLLQGGAVAVFSRDAHLRIGGGRGFGGCGNGEYGKRGQDQNCREEQGEDPFQFYHHPTLFLIDGGVFAQLLLEHIEEVLGVIERFVRERGRDLFLRFDVHSCGAWGVGRGGEQLFDTRPGGITVPGGSGLCIRLRLNVLPSGSVLILPVPGGRLSFGRGTVAFPDRVEDLGDAVGGSCFFMGGFFLGGSGLSGGRVLLADRRLGDRLAEIQAVPYQKDIDRPDLAGMILFLFKMLVQIPQQNIGVEEHLGGGREEHILYDVIVVLVLEPHAGRHGEAQLLLLGDLVGQMARGCLAHRVLGVVFIDPQLGGDRGGYVEHFLIEEGNAQLQRVRHAHAVSLEQDVADHPCIDVDVLHLGHVVPAAGAGVEAADQARRIAGEGRVLEQRFLLLFVIHIGVADEALLQRMGGADQVVATLDVGQLLTDPADESSQKVGADRLVYLKDAGVVIDRVAAEELVGALAREDDLNVLRRELRDEVQRDAGRIGERLIHVVLHLRHRCPEFLRRDELRVMLHADLLRQRLRPCDLVVFFSEVEADGEGLLTLKIGGDIRGIHARRQKTADLDVGDLVGVDGVFKDLPDLIRSLLLGHIVIGLELGLEPALGLDHPVAVPQEVTRQQTVDVLEERHRLGAVLVGQVGVEGALVEALDEFRVLQDRLDLRGVAEVVADHGVVQRLDAEIIAREEQRFGLFVIDREREHPAQAGQAFLIPLLKGVHEHLAVGTGAELMSQLLQLLLKILVVIDLAVVGQDQRAVLIRDRLVAALEVDDTQPAKAHGDGIVHVQTVRVGTAVSDDLGHLLYRIFSLLRLTRKAANTAHIAKLLSSLPAPSLRCAETGTLLVL